MNNQGDSPASADRTATPAAAPDAPGTPGLTVGNAQLGVSWSEPANNGASISDYDVRYRAGNSGPWTDANYNGTGTSTTIASLANGTSYQVQVRARNSVGWGGWSDSASDTPAAAPDAPGTPTLTPGNEQITVEWAASAANGAAIDDYDVQYKQSGVTAWTAHPHSGAGRSTVIAGLTNGQSYDVQVLAKNGVGSSGWSPSATDTPAAAPAAPAMVPAKPANFAAAAGNGQVVLSWDNPNDGTIIKWQVRRKTTGGYGSWSDISGSGPSTISHTVGGLTNGTDYTFKVRAVNRTDNGVASNGASATPATTPDAPDVPTLTPGDGQLKVDWTAPSDNGGAAITEYDVRVLRASDGEIVSEGNTSSGTTLTITHLTNGVSYRVLVRAKNSVGNSQWSDSASAMPTAQAPQAPDAPEAPTLIPGDGEIEVTWDAPADNGAAITDYDVGYKLSRSGWKIELNAGPSTTTTISVIITGLTNGFTYQVRVRAANSAGEGLWSDLASAIPAAAAPAAPTNFAATAGDGEVMLTWDNPGDTSISKWQYRSATAANGGGGWADIPSSTKDTVSHTVASLTNGQVHYFQVRAVNSSGDGAASDEASATPVAKPAKPASFAAAVGSGEVTLTWDNPNNATITRWQYQQKEGADSYGDWTGILPSVASTSSYTVINLANGTRYTFKLRAVNESGNGIESDEASATPIAVPGKPTGFTASPGDGEVRLTWNDPGDSAITRWQYQQKAGSGSYGVWTGIPSSGASTSSYTVTNLANGTRYTFKLRAVNASGNGVESDEASATPIAAPGKPSGFTASAGDSEVRLTWGRSQQRHHHPLAVPAEGGRGQLRRLDRHPVQRRLDQLAHGHQSGQRYALHLQAAGAERERPRRPVQRGQRHALRRRARGAPGPGERRAGGWR